MDKISNKEAMGEELVKMGKIDRDIIVLTSDARNSSSITNFVKELPEQFIEVGIAEQNMVSIAAGLAATGKKPFITSPACFLSSRTVEQIKNDVAYSNTNVKIIGISGGLSYGALGMTHHSLQDIATMRAIPGMTVILPADRYETQNMVEALVDYKGPVYSRLGRNPVPVIYESGEYGFKIGKAVTLKQGSDITIIATGETVKIAVDSASELQKSGITCRVLDMHTIKPLDEDAIIKAAEETGCIITIEEHSIYGGLGGAVAEVVAQNNPAYMKIIGIPDEPAITGTPAQMYDHYGLSIPNITMVAKKMLKK